MDNDSRYLDIESALNRVRGKSALIKRLLTMFLQGKHFDEFEAALEECDFEKASEVAHAIKGETANLSMPLLSETAGSLMVQLRNGPPDSDTLETYREALQRTLELVQVAIDTME